MSTLVSNVLFVGIAALAVSILLRRAEPSLGTPSYRRSSWRLRASLFAAFAMLPTLARAQTVDLRTATESGNAIIMYLSGAFAAIGIVAAGVAMMTGRQSIAKWAFAGAMVSGLAFAIVRTMWSNMGLEAADVGSF